MKYPLSLIALTALLTACGGGSSSSKTETKTEQKPDTSGQFCGTSLTLQGISVKISDFDLDKNGCINADEQKKIDAHVAEEVAKVKAAAEAKAAKTLSADGDNTSTKDTAIKINKLTVTGNADVSDEKIQIHANMSSGRFEVVANVDVPKGATDQIRVMFAEPNTVATPTNDNNISINGAAFSTNAQIGKNLTLDCVYTTTSLKCSIGLDELPAITLNHAPPAALELVILACEGNTDTCPNRGKVNVSLN